MAGRVGRRCGLGLLVILLRATVVVPLIRRVLVLFVLHGFWFALTLQNMIFLGFGRTARVVTVNEKQSESKWRAHSTASLPQMPAIAQQKQEVDADLQLSKICKQGQLEAEEQARSSHASSLNQRNNSTHSKTHIIKSEQLNNQKRIFS